MAEVAADGEGVVGSARGWAGARSLSRLTPPLWNGKGTMMAAPGRIQPRASALWAPPWREAFLEWPRCVGRFGPYAEFGWRHCVLGIPKLMSRP